MLPILVCRKASCFTVWFLHNSCVTTACQCFEKAMASLITRLLMLATYCCFGGFFFEKLNLPLWSYSSEAHLAIYNKPVSMSVCLRMQALAGVEGPSQARPLLSRVTALCRAWYQLMKFHIKNKKRVSSSVIFMLNLPQGHFFPETYDLFSNI